MTKLLRSVALILIPCLIVDPVMASSILYPSSPLVFRRNNPFEQEALAASLVASKPSNTSSLYFQERRKLLTLLGWAFVSGKAVWAQSQQTEDGDEVPPPNSERLFHGQLSPFSKEQSAIVTEEQGRLVEFFGIASPMTARALSQLKFGQWNGPIPKGTEAAYAKNLNIIFFVPDLATRLGAGPAFRFVIDELLIYFLRQNELLLSGVADSIELMPDAYATVSALHVGGLGELAISENQFVGNLTGMITYVAAGAAVTRYRDPDERHRVLVSMIKDKYGKLDLADRESASLAKIAYSRVQGTIAWIVAKGHPKNAFHYLRLLEQGMTPGETERIIYQEVLHLDTDPRVTDFLDYVPQDPILKHYQWPDPDKIHALRDVSGGALLALAAPLIRWPAGIPIALRPSLEHIVAENEMMPTCVFLIDREPTLRRGPSQGPLYIQLAQTVVNEETQLRKSGQLRPDEEGPAGAQLHQLLQSTPAQEPVKKIEAEKTAASNPKLLLVYTPRMSAADLDIVRPEFDAAMEKTGGQSAAFTVINQGARIGFDSAFRNDLLKDHFLLRKSQLRDYADLVAQGFRETHASKFKKPFRWEQLADDIRHTDEHQTETFSAAWADYMADKQAAGYDIDILPEHWTAETVLHSMRTQALVAEATKMLEVGNLNDFVDFLIKSMAAYHTAHHLRSEWLYSEAIPSVTRSGRVALVTRNNEFIGEDAALTDPSSYIRWNVGHVALWNHDPAESLFHAFRRHEVLEESVKHDLAARQALVWLLQTTWDKERIPYISWMRIVLPWIQMLPVDAIQRLFSRLSREKNIDRDRSGHLGWQSVMRSDLPGFAAAKTDIQDLLKPAYHDALEPPKPLSEMESRAIAREARALRNAGEGEKAIDLLQEKIGDYPENPTLLISLAFTYLFLKNPRQAEGPAKKAVMLDPYSPLARMALANSYADQNLLEEARRQGHAQVELEPDNSAPRYALAQIYERLGLDHYRNKDWAQAAKRLKSALHYDGSRLRAYDFLIKIYKRKKDWARVADLADRALLIDSDSSQRMMWAAIAHRHLGHSDRVYQLYTEALKRWPKSAGLRVALSKFFLDVDDFEAARDEAELAVQYDPDSSQAHTMLATILLATFRSTQAKKEVLEAIRLDPNNFAAQDLAANVLATLGEFPLAITYIGRVLAGRPDDVRAYRTLLHVCQLAEDWPLGIIAARRACELAPENLSFQSRLNFFLYKAQDSSQVTNVAIRPERQALLRLIQSPKTVDVTVIVRGPSFKQYFKIPPKRKNTVEVTNSNHALSLDELRTYVGRVTNNRHILIVDGTPKTTVYKDGKSFLRVRFEVEDLVRHSYIELLSFDHPVTDYYPVSKYLPIKEVESSGPQIRITLPVQLSQGLFRRAFTAQGRTLREALIYLTRQNLFKDSGLVDLLLTRERTLRDTWVVRRGRSKRTEPVSLDEELKQGDNFNIAPKMSLEPSFTTFARKKPANGPLMARLRQAA